MWHGSRRAFLKTAGAVSGLALTAAHGRADSLIPTSDQKIEVLNPRLRVPLSFIIDDSTCLVNMGRFCMPQFAAAWPDRADYQKPWRTWPAEIPDAFVREFGEWCAEQGVKGKYSVVPFPACVGWLDRELPGWSRKELLDSLRLVRELMVPNWDIHPEMITHTHVIDLRTGRPSEALSAELMENWYPQTNVSVDELTAYLAYALKILKNCDLPCEGITTPGGFGSRVKNELSLAVQESVRDVFGSEIPHYFKYVAGDNESTQPRIENARDLTSDDPRLTVSIYAGTGDWFGGWDGDRQPEGDRYCNRDATQGKMVELIERGEPAVMLCHWAGMYSQGAKHGFSALQRVIRSLQEHKADQTLWMKPSEMARYWAAKTLTQATMLADHYELTAPFASPVFTVRVPRPQTTTAPPALSIQGTTVQLKEVSQPHLLRSGTWLREPTASVLCFDLSRGRTIIRP